MARQVFSACLRKSVMFRLGILAGIIGILIGCGGGGDGVSSYSSVGDGGAGDGDIPPAVDQAPMAMISSPIDTFFNEGENIVFSGTGTDVEDGQLNDGALVWTSSIDGPIGTGPTLITSVLSPGDHDIALTATDSNGATHTETVSFHVEPTRFIKMGFQTTGVLDASNAFDGDLGTAATITTSETEFIHFKAFIGGEDTFLFRVKSGISTIGSSLAIEGLTEGDSWQTVSDIKLDADKTVTVKITDAQAFKDANGYINLRALLVNGQSPDSVTIYELWRVDPIYAGPQTIDVKYPEQAFDGDRSNPATITNTLENSGNLLHFKAYVGVGQSDAFAFKILLEDIELPGHYLVIQVEDIISGNWEFVSNLSLDTDDARTVSIQDAQSYLDTDGYISLRAYWFTFNTNYPPETQVNVYEIWRIDPFIVGPKTTSFGLVLSPENAVDGNLDSFTTIYYFWGESEHKDFLHVQTYLGDASNVTFSISTAPSAPGSELIIDGEYEPDSWSVVKRISLDGLVTTTIELPNAREFVNADGYLSLRARWESDSPNYDAYIYEIWREEN
jgi:hypothetical protein